MFAGTGLFVVGLLIMVLAPVMAEGGATSHPAMRIGGAFLVAGAVLTRSELIVRTINQSRN